MAGARDYQAPVHCAIHHIDMAALRRFIADGRPHDHAATIEAIGLGECPACRPRYTAGFRAAEPTAHSFSAVALGAPCPCCASTWRVDADGWRATTGDGLALGNAGHRVPNQRTIGQDRFVIDPFDPIGGPAEAVRDELLAFDALSGHPAEDDLVDDLTESLSAVLAARADFDAELGRIAAEHGLDTAAADAWVVVAGGLLGVLRSLIGSSTRRTQCPRCSNPAAGVHVSRAVFEQLIREALDSIPDDLAGKMDNVAVVASRRSELPGLDHLLGVYQGVDLTRRQSYGGSAPDRITLFQETMSRHCDSLEELAEQVRRTVIHEVAHHFGIGDPELRSLGW